jgi:hypothetical protein
MLPAGTKLDVEITYDNSAENPRNPNNPPIRIKWGEDSTDEMGNMSLTMTPVNEADLDKFLAAQQRSLKTAAAKYRRSRGR